MKYMIVDANNRIPREVDFTVSVTLICPAHACGQLVSVGYYVGENGQQEPAVLHVEPLCAEYDQHDILSYLRWARKSGAKLVKVSHAN